MNTMISADELDWARDLAVIRQMIEAERTKPVPARNSRRTAGMPTRAGVIVLLSTHRS